MKPIRLRDLSTALERRTKLENELHVSLSASAASVEFEKAIGHNCENLIGATQIPLGVAGPLNTSNIKHQTSNIYLPLATTEGALVASINRGCKAICASGGAITNSQRVGVTRGPVFYTGGIKKTQRFYEWIRSNEEKMAKISESTSHHLTYNKAEVTSVGKYTYIRFSFDTQDAMGMNMVTIATQKLVEFIENETD
ncbi:MAG: 3-hydroxy-3-methylglutaryl-CoA reductase, partial [Patescibacteria group bacterium]